MAVYEKQADGTLKLIEPDQAPTEQETEIFEPEVEETE